MKSIKSLILIGLVFYSCSKDEGTSTSSCNDIVCGYTRGAGGITYVIYKGTVNPDNCGTTQLTVNVTTYNFYKNKLATSTNGTCCWEGLK